MDQNKTLTKTTKNKLNLNKVKEVVFQNIFPLLDSFSLEYSLLDNNIFMKCPIHEASDNPNGLSISLQKEKWRCWTRGCQEHYSSDIFGFVKGCLKTDNFSEALKHICNVYNLNSKKDVTLTTPDPKKEEEDEFCKLVNIFKKNTSFL